MWTIAIDEGELRNTLSEVHSVSRLSARLWRSGSSTLHWMPAKKLCGLTPWAGVTHGYCAGRTKRAFVVVFASGFANDSYRWRDYLTRPATGLDYP